MAEQAKTAEGATTGASEVKENTTEKITGAKKGAGKTAEGATTEAKVYNFTSANKFLSCVGLGIQFINGKASTTNLEVAKELAKIDGVELVEK